MKQKISCLTKYKVEVRKKKTSGGNLMKVFSLSDVRSSELVNFIYRKLIYKQNDVFQLCHC